MGFTKLDSRIIDSSIWEDPAYVLKLFITFWTKSDLNGIVSATKNAIFRSSNLPEHEFEDGLNRLMSDDGCSRSKDKDGKRIVRLEESKWLIVNYLKYRDYTYSDNPDAIKKRRQRGHAGDMSQSVQGHSVSVSVSDSVSVSVSKKEKGDWGEREGTRKLLDSVYLTDQECDRLKNELGINFFEACVEKLNAYLVNNEAKRKKYKNHNLVIRDWVITEIGKKMQKSSEKTRGAARWE
jgi:hypothetical protein